MASTHLNSFCCHNVTLWCVHAVLFSVVIILCVHSVVVSVTRTSHCRMYFEIFLCLTCLTVVRTLRDILCGQSVVCTLCGSICDQSVTLPCVHYVMFAVAKASHFGVYTLRFPLCSKWVGLWEITLSPTMLSIPWFILGPITFPGASSLSLSLCFHSPTLFHHFSRVCNFLKLYRVLSGKDVLPIVFVFFLRFYRF